MGKNKMGKGGSAVVDAGKPQWTKIRGHVYDVSKFQHPGGNILKMFHGLDSTTAFESFHGHNVRAEMFLKSLPKLDKIDDTDYAPKQSDGHVEATTAAIAKWKEEGLFEPRPVISSIYGLVTVAVIVGAVILAPHYPLMAGLLVGTAWAHCGFLQHMGGHRELGSVSLAWQHFFEGLCKGGSGSWWRNRHNKHHAKTNVVGEDGDLRTTPFFAWDAANARKCKGWSLRTQAFTFIPALGAYVFLFALTVRKFVLVKKLWLEAVLMVAHYTFFICALRAAGCTFGAAAAYYAIGYAFQGIYLGFFFSLSHFAVERVP